MCMDPALGDSEVELREKWLRLILLVQEQKQVDQVLAKIESLLQNRPFHPYNDKEKNKFEQRK